MQSMSSTKINLSCNIDDYIQGQMDEKRCALWHAILSNGEHIIQDDNRPGCEPASAWIRLKMYCEMNYLNIEKVWLQFRTHVVDDLPKNASGYFFAKNLIGIMGSKENLFSYLVGFLVDDKIHVSMYSVPALTLIESTQRDIVSTSPDCIIRNRQWTQEKTQLISTI